MVSLGPVVPLSNSVVGNFYGIDDLIVKLQAAYDAEMAPYAGQENYANAALYSNAGAYLDAALRARAALRGSSGTWQENLFGFKRVDLTAENEFPLLHSTVQAGIRNNPELAILSQFGLYDVPQTGDLNGWRLWTRNGSSGDFLSVGAEGGVNALANVRWHPDYGLLIPTSAYLTIHEEPDWAGMIVMAGLMAFGGAVIGAAGSVTGSTAVVPQGGVITGMAPGLTDAEIMALYETAQAGGTLPAGVVYDSMAAFNAAYEAAAWTSSPDWLGFDGVKINPVTTEGAIDILPNADTVTEAAKTVAKSVPLPQNIPASGLADFLPKLDKFIPSLAGLKTAAGLAGTFASLYKLVTNPNGTQSYQLRPTPLTPGQLAAQNPGMTSGSNSFSSLLPVLIVAGISLLN